MEVDRCREGKLEDVQVVLHLLDLEHGPELTVVLQDLCYLPVHFEEARVPWDFKQGEEQSVDVVHVEERVRTEYDY